MQPMTVEWGNCAKWLRLPRLAPLMSPLQSVTSASSWKTRRVFFFFPVMWLIFTQYRPWPASLPPAAAPEHSQPLTPSQGALPTDKSYTYSFGRRRYSWHSGQQQKYRFWQQTKQPSVNTKGRLQFYYSIRTLWHHDVLSASAASSFDINNICKSTLTTIWIFNNPITTQ